MVLHNAFGYYITELLALMPKNYGLDKARLVLRHEIMKHMILKHENVLWICNSRG